MRDQFTTSRQPSLISQISTIAETADLNSEESMQAAWTLITGLLNRTPGGLTETRLYASCVDAEDPSQLYDALVMLGASDR